MKRLIFPVLIFITAITVLVVPFAKAGPGPKKKHRPVPAIFGANVISTTHDEFGASFTPDGKTCYFSMKSPSTITNNIVIICFSQFIRGHWSEPVVAPFSGRYQDFNPCVSPDGNRIYFISDRPVDGKKRRDTDIWMADISGGVWSDPKNLGAPVNSAGWELGCSVSTDGTLFFSSTGTNGNVDLYSSKLVDGKYEQPVNLGEMVNSAAVETDPFIAPDGSYLLFSSTGRSDGMNEAGASISYPRGDLYISFYQNGHWTEAKNLGPDVNSTAEESNPWVSPDGKTLYYTSERNFVTIPMKQKLTYKELHKKLRSLENGLGNIYETPFLKK